jgi:predicted nucleic acid-binding Zn ribbon protein
MSTLNQILDLPASSSIDDLQSAYNFKRAELLARQSSGEDVATPLQELDQAYILWQQAPQQTGTQALASTNLQPTPQPIIPLGLYSSEAAQPVSQPRTCPACGAANPSQASVCTSCGTQLGRSCPKCGFFISLDQVVCPRCSTVVNEYDQRRFAEGVITGSRVQKEREEEHIRVQNLEAGHSVRAGLGALFWIIVVAACIGLSLLAAYIYNQFSS